MKLNPASASTPVLVKKRMLRWGSGSVGSRFPGRWSRGEQRLSCRSGEGFGRSLQLTEIRCAGEDYAVDPGRRVGDREHSARDGAQRCVRTNLAPSERPGVALADVARVALGLREEVGRINGSGVALRARVPRRALRADRELSCLEVLRQQQVVLHLQRGDRAVVDL